jgi:hypothetical protein
MAISMGHGAWGPSEIGAKGTFHGVNIGHRVRDQGSGEEQDKAHSWKLTAQGKGRGQRREGRGRREEFRVADLERHRA